MESNTPIDFSSPESRRRHYQRRAKAMRTELESFIPHYKDITNYTQPRRGRYLTTDRNKGDKRNQNILDNTGTKASRVAAAGMMSGMTSPARPWFKFGAQDPGLTEFTPVRLWLDTAERLIREIMARTNMYNSLHTCYGELVDFGTHCLLVDEDAKDVFRVYAMTAGEYALGLSERNTVNAMTREWSLSVWQLVERYGLKNCSRNVQEKYKAGKYDEWVEVAQLIQPNVRARGDSLRPDRMPISSVHYEKNEPGHGDPQFLRESGYQEDPVLGPRWDVRGTDIYGSSPGMIALGDIKQLQLQQRRKAQAIDKMVDPPMTGPTSLANQPTSTLPGGITLSDTAAAGGGFRPAYQVNPQIDHLRADIIETQTRIKEAYYEDLFRMTALLDQRQPVTAREIAERHEEKLLQLGPVLERLQNELLDPLIDRVFAICSRAGLLPPAPREIAGTSLKVEYISVLAQAQRAVGTSTIERVVGFVGGIAQMHPEVVDKVDFDQAVDEYSRGLGSPPKMIVGDKEVAEKRKARAQLQANQQRVQETIAAAETDKTVAETEQVREQPA